MMGVIFQREGFDGSFPVNVLKVQPACHAAEFFREQTLCLGRRRGLEAQLTDEKP